MKKKGKKVLKEPKVKFDNSLIMVFLAALILLISFALYSNYNIKEEYKELAQEEEIIEEPILLGDECTADSDCPQPKCPGMEGKCKNGYCIVRRVSPATTKCFDLKATVCGNKVCESDEKNRCSEDC